jgi:hypothetical protein
MSTLTEAVTAYEAQLNTVVGTFVAANAAAEGNAALTAADRIQTGEDRIAASGSAADALASKDTAVSAQLDITTNWGDKLATASTQAGIATAGAETATTQAGISLDHAGLAATAKTAAELARDAAMVMGKVYATTAAGLADVASGQYFSVPSPDSAEHLILYENVSGVATERKRYPSAAAVQAIAEAVRASVDQPNLFTAARLAFTTLPDTVGGSISQTSVGGLKAGLLASETVNGIGRCKWSFPVSGFPSGKASALIVVDSSTAGTSGTISIVERNDAGSQIAATTLVTGLAAAITTPTTFQASGVTLNALTVTVDLDVNLVKSTGDKLRTATLRSMMLCDGSVNGFRQPLPVIPPVPTINYFPNPALTQAGSTRFEATTILENAEAVLDVSGAASGDTRQVYYEVPAMGAFSPGNIITLAAQCFTDVGAVGDDADVALMFLDAAGASTGTTIVASATSAGAYHTLAATQTVPVLAARVRLRFVKRPGPSVVRFRRPTLTSSNALALVVNEGVIATYKTVFVSPSGIDTASGTKTAPLKTLAVAVAEVWPSGRIVMREGDYTSGASIAGCSKVEIMAHRGERVRIILGTKLAGITKTDGYAKVYQAALASKPSGWVWEHDTPDVRTLIASADRLALQRGRTHRLPSTHIDEVASIAAVDAATTPSWYWAVGVLYFSASDGGNAAAREYRVPFGDGGISGGTGVEEVRIDNISTWYSGAHGWDARSLTRWEANNAQAFCGASNGFSRDDTRVSIERFCEAAGNRIDGFNAHRTAANAYHEPVPAQSLDNWSHDNGDDGDSYHEDCIGSYFGGLYEYNGDRGIATAYGSHTTAYGTVSRFNGQIDPSGGEGFCAIGAVVPADDNGVGTQMDCYGCQSYGNLHNYRTSDASAKMTVVNSKSWDAVTGQYTNAAGSMTLIDCSSAGTGAVKTGVITIKNTALVV